MGSLTGADIIELFGGLGPLHEITGLPARNVGQWKYAGVAARYWHLLVPAAERLGIPGVTFATLAAGHELDRQRTNARVAARELKRQRAQARAVAKLRRAQAAAVHRGSV